MAGQTNALGVQFRSACGRLISCCHESLLQSSVSPRASNSSCRNDASRASRARTASDSALFECPCSSSALRRANGWRRPQGMHAPHRSPPWPARAAVGARDLARDRVLEERLGLLQPALHLAMERASSASFALRGCTAAGVRLCETPSGQGIVKLRDRKR